MKNEQKRIGPREDLKRRAYGPLLLGLLLLVSSGRRVHAQGFGGSSSSSSTTTTSGQPVQPPAAVPQSAFQGSVSGEKIVPGVRPLSLKDAIQIGLHHNLGLLLSGENIRQAGGQQLQQLQALLPTITADFKEAVQQVNLKAQGLNIPGIPTIVGPYAYSDVRANLNWTLLNFSELQSYKAAKHNFEGTKLSLADAVELVIVGVGYEYLRCVADEANVVNDQAQVASTNLSLAQAKANRQAGTSPQIDELRSLVDYQTQQQTLIADQNSLEKDKIALLRAIGLPTEQKFALTDQSPYLPLGNLDPETALKTAYANRKDLAALEEQVRGAEANLASARAERLPSVAASGDYGDIGPTFGHSHGTFDVTGTATVPVFEEAKLRGDALLSQSQLQTLQARLSDMRGQIDADLRDAFLDLQSSQQQVDVARSNVSLANQTLADAQQRFAAGVSDNLPVSQAQATVAQSNSVYVASLYQNNLAKLELARAMGIVQSKFKEIFGGK